VFDGLKIECNYLAANWLNNDNMDFPVLVNFKTGELYNVPRIYKNNGLKFKLTPSPTQPNKTYATIQGSIHKFYNNGLNNATNFSFGDVCHVIETLKNAYQVQPSETPLRNLEIGINIELPIPVKEFLKMVVSMPKKRFSALKVENQNLGKVCKLGDKLIKIYDKGKQSNLPVDNLLRIELKYTRMRELTTQYGIRTLADLTDLNKVKELKKLLIDTFEKVIIFENNIQPDTLKKSQQIKYWKYTSPFFWENLNPNTRHKASRRYEVFFNNIAPQTIKKTIINLISEKWELLTNSDHQKKPYFTPKNNNSAAVKLAMFATLECKRQTSLNPPNITKNTSTQNLPEIAKIAPRKKPKFCRSCGRDISHQRKDSIFCSEKYFIDAKKCRNKASGKLRTAKKQKARKQETIKLNVLLPILHKTNLLLLIFKNSSTTHQRKRQKSIKDISYDKLKQITKVRIRIDKKTLEFTTLRAKKLIKQIIKINSYEK